MNYVLAAIPSLIILAAAIACGCVSISRTPVGEHQFNPHLNEDAKFWEGMFWFALFLAIMAPFIFR